MIYWSSFVVFDDVQKKSSCCMVSHMFSSFLLGLLNLLHEYEYETPSCFPLWRPYTLCDHLRPNRDQHVAFTIKIAWEINRNKSCLAGGDVESNTRMKSSGSVVSVGPEWQRKMSSSSIDIIRFDSHSHKEVCMEKRSIWCLTLLVEELYLLEHLKWSRSVLPKHVLEAPSPAPFICLL